MKRCCAPVLMVLLLLPVSGRAQDYDDSDDDTSTPQATELYLRFNKQGATSVDFSVGEKVQNWDTLRQALGAGLHCPAAQFHSPAIDSYITKSAYSWPASKRDQYLRSLADVNSKRLVANCESVLRWDGVGREGVLTLQPLASALRQIGSQRFWLVVSLPTSSNVQYSRENLVLTPSTPRFLTYQIAISDASRPLSPIQLSYGVTRQSLYKNAGIGFAFILLPVLVILWMRRAALKVGKSDPTAAWFSYFRTLNWCIQISMLLWITSGLGARQALQDWLSFAFSRGWHHTLLDAAVVIGPPFFIYFVCVAVSYPVHFHLRGTQWTRREFLQQQLVNLGVQVLPLMFFLAAIENLTKSGSATATFFLLAALSLVALSGLKMRIGKAYPHSLSTGELRDFVFALANKARVKLTQVIVLPTGKGQVANAYASGSRMVMFTDYLLQHLTKREVNAVAAHEIAHLELGHVKKRALAFYGAVIVPGLLGTYVARLFQITPATTQSAGLATRLYLGAAWFWHWSQRDFVLIVSGLLLFYLLSRRFEFAADERAVQLNGDAEAQITGLLKLNRLNLMPIQWGKGTGSWLTHPSTLRRAERIAASSGMSATQLYAILDRHQAEEKSAVRTSAAEDHYAVPEATDPENIRSTASKRVLHQLRLWALLLMHVLPPTAIALLVRARPVYGTPALVLYATGIVLTPLICIGFTLQLGLLGRKGQRARLAQRFNREGLQLNRDAIAVGFSPGAVVRFYGLNYYNWDIGFLVLSGDRISFIGEQVRFSVNRGQIDSICLGQGGPSWKKFPRIYIRWKQPDGRPSVFSLANLEPCSVWQISRQGSQLFDRLQDFTNSPRNTSHEPLQAFPPLTLGDVTSRSPRELGGLKSTGTVLLFVLPLAVVANAIADTDAIFYILGTVLLTRLMESIPYWRFRDRLLQFDTARSNMAVAAKIST